MVIVGRQDKKTNKNCRPHKMFLLIAVPCDTLSQNSNVATWAVETFLLMSYKLIILTIHIAPVSKIFKGALQHEHKIHVF